MNRIVASLLVACVGFAQSAMAADTQRESCDQIRAQISAHAGTPSKPNTALLGKVGANKSCRFTSAEAYRAAWGDKPMPKDDRPARQSKHKEQSHD